MFTKRLIAGTLSVGMMVLGADVAWGQNYPNKPIRIVTGLPTGGDGVSARLIAQGISGPLGQPVVVDHRPPALTAEIVANAAPDGYTLLNSSANLWTAPLLQAMPFDPVRDFSPITLVEKSPNVLVVHPSLPVKSVKDLIALAKARPGELNYAHGSTGSSGHIAGELFKAMAGVNIVHVGYKTSAQSINDLLSGAVQMTLGSPTAMMPLAQSGKLRALAVTTGQPSALFPGLPTIAASGLPGYDWGSVTGMFAPANTPRAIINQLNQEMVRVLNQPDVKQKFIDSTMEATSSSPEQLAATLKSDMANVAKVSKVIKDAGIKTE